MSDWRDTYPAADRGYEPLLESIVERVGNRYRVPSYCLRALTRESRAGSSHSLPPMAR